MHSLTGPPDGSTATKSSQTGAADLPFYPAVPASWSGVQKQVAAALDYLRAAVTWNDRILAINATLPASAYASWEKINERVCLAFDKDTDESAIFEGVVSKYFTGTGTLKIDILASAATTTAADDVRWDVTTEFRTPGASESMSSDNFDASADSGTMTFSTTTESLQLLTITLAPATTPAAGDYYRIKVTRDANNASSLDDLASDCHLWAVRVYEE